MTVLRSREVVSSIKSHTPLHTPRKTSMEPCIPAESMESPSNHTPDPTPLNSGDHLNLGLPLTPLSEARNSLRRSPRLAASSKSTSDGTVLSDSSRKRKRVGDETGLPVKIFHDSRESFGSYISVDGLQMNVVETKCTFSDRDGVENGVTGEIGLDVGAGDDDGRSMPLQPRMEGNNDFGPFGLIQIDDDEEDAEDEIDKEDSTKLGLLLKDIAEKSDRKLNLKELDGDSTHVETRKRLSSQEKGKGKMVDDSSGIFGTDAKKPDLSSELGIDRNIVPIIQHQPPSHLADHKSPDKETLVLGIKASETVGKQRNYREAFRDVAKKNAQRFALFSSEEANANAGDARVVATGENAMEKEDWPGPFSTALKIIKDRTVNANLPRQVSNLHKNKLIDITWIPKKDQHCGGTKRPVPSLQEMCTHILAKNASSITSLEGVPDVMRHNLCQLLSDSRTMDAHYLELLTHGSPTEIRVKDCSWLTEEEFVRIFEGCNTSYLTVLQLDQSGRCLTDYNLPSLFGQTSKSLPALFSMSVKGACRLTDDGLHTLVAATPELRSINLSQCSLLTGDSIFFLAESVQGLRELYLDDCETIDASLILPALLNLEYLEVLSLASMPRVSDDFITEFVTIRGPNIKELTLSNCMQLTDSSIKVIGENCPGLLALDLVNLQKLTDTSIGYLANGCRTIQTLKLRRNSFSDEGIAAYLEASGRSLTELSLNNINQVGSNTAISLAKCCRDLVSLDLSWCRKMADEAVGLIVDSCSSLKVLRLFGCTQISDVFVNGHSNRELQIIGLNMMPVLKYINLHNTSSDGALRY